jgi:hypothetical protein
MLVPDPNNFGGEIRIWRAGAKEWASIPLAFGYSENARGVGAADMAKAIVSGRPHRASGELAYHVLEAMHGFHDASEQGAHYQMRSTCTRPAPFPLGMQPYMLD